MRHHTSNNADISDGVSVSTRNSLQNGLQLHIDLEREYWRWRSV